ncbi:MAG: DNA mismatch repair protein MutS [Anaerolineae bacterium]|nr:DNA mismatch repair protein MutS [Anaerolineae bacterium]
MTVATPMRQQYLAIKKQFPGTIVLFRLGDFYESFDEDAKTVAQVCDVVLTSRPVGKNVRVPLAGVPYHAVEGYIAKLIAAGYKVAIAEQQGTEAVKGLVPRDVRRVITPGTLVEPGLLEEKRNNYLAALVRADDHVGLAYADITTGEFATTELSGAELEARLSEELGRIAPSELLVPENGAGDRDEGQGALGSYLISPLPVWRFEPGTARQALLDHFGVASLEGYGCERLPLAIAAAGAIIQYLRETQRGAVGQIVGLRTYTTAEYMALDEATRRNLELTQTIRSGRVRGSLLGVLDTTRTAMGARLLRRWLNQPLLTLAPLQGRLDAVEAWTRDTPRRTEIREMLRHVGDLERLINRVTGRTATPRDLVGVRKALEQVPRIRSLAEEVMGRAASEAHPENAPPQDAGAFHLDSCDDVAALIAAAISDTPPVALSTGDVIRPGFSAELDSIVTAARDAKTWIANLERTERERSGIKSLKVGYNKVFGYYIEVTNANRDAVPTHYLRKQTLVGAERYITPELKEYESLVLNAEDRILDLETQLFRQVCDQVASAAPRVLATAQALAELDVSASLAEIAANNRYVRPELAENGLLEIRAGRHPVVELTLRDEPFVPNDLHLSPDESIVILTGPNMAGKSTFLRQVALIVLMAQIGSFVPADSAHIGLVDRIFTRIGAQDEISAGQSTFMVEMVETANILHHATPRSLLILDEIGRGTSTYDGMSIAWAVVEYIHNHPRLGAKTLFATHYHELTELAKTLPRLRNYNVAVHEEGGRVVFLRKIVPGGADRSYGIHVGKLAGLPRTVIQRAEEVLRELERSREAKARRAVVPPPVQLSLFGQPSAIEQELAALDVLSMSPLDALNKLYELSQKAGGKGGEKR